MTTTAMSMSTASAGAVMKWVFDCVAAHQLVPPDQTAEFVIAGVVLPILQSVKMGLVTTLAVGQAVLLQWIENRVPEVKQVLAQETQSPEQQEQASGQVISPDATEQLRWYATIAALQQEATQKTSPECATRGPSPAASLQEAGATITAGTPIPSPSPPSLASQISPTFNSGDKT
jgi:hypothetical protein